MLDCRMRRPTGTLPLLLGVTSIGLAGLGPGCGRGAAVEVEVARVEKRPVFRSTVTASGEIVAERYADVGSSVMGKLVSLPVKEGDRVRKGQVVARIDSVPASSERDAATALVRAVEADQAAARAQAEDAARALARGRELRGQGLLPQAEFDGLQGQMFGILFGVPFLDPNQKAEPAAAPAHRPALDLDSGLLHALQNDLHRLTLRGE